MRTHALSRIGIPPRQERSGGIAIRAISRPLMAAYSRPFGPSPIPALTADALTAVESLIWALRSVPGRPYLREYQDLAVMLRRGDLEAAIKAGPHIPWFVESDDGIRGMAVYEHRYPRVRKAAEATQRALSRLKVCVKYGVIPKS